MRGAAVDPASELLQHADQVGALDPRRELVGDLLQGTVVVEIEAERLLAGGDDLRRQILRLDDGPRRRHDGLLDDVFEFPDIPRPVVAKEP